MPAPDPTPQPPFCGRERDLALLTDAWRAVAGGRGPRLVALLAESGLGKTRLVQEFYARLAAEHRSPEGRGYWPPTLGRAGENLVVNPERGAVDAEQVMPFLWWGVRLADPEGRNRVVSGAVASHLSALTAHLQPMARAQRQKRRWLESGRVVGGVALGFIPVLGGLADLGQAAFELERLRREERSDRELAPAEAERRSAAELGDRIVGDLEQLFRRGRAEAAIPMVWFVDDAHFSPADPDLTTLLARLLTRADDEGWPLLVVTTHWEREWHDQRSAEGSVAAAVEGVWRPRYPGWSPTALSPIGGDALAPALTAQLPGLTPEQRRSLLLRAGGNPRFLDEIVRLCLQRPRYFEGRDPGGALTERGLAEVLAVSTELRNLVEARLNDAPPEVRTLVTLSSLQGVRLLYLVSRGVLDALRERGHTLPAERPREALELARTPYAFLNLLDGQLAEFSQRVFFEVAREGIEDLVDADQAEAALIEALRRLNEGGAAEVAELSDEEQGLLLELASEVLARSGDGSDRQLALSALAQLAGRTFLTGDFRAGGELAERALAGAEGGRWQLERLHPWELQGLSFALQLMGRLDPALRLALLARDAAASSGDTADLVRALEHLAGVRQERGEGGEALATAGEGLELARARAEREGSAEARSGLASPLYNVATRLRDAGEPGQALPLYREGLELARALEAEGIEDAGWMVGNFQRCVGMVLAEVDDTEAALVAHREGLATFEALFRVAPTPSLRRDLWLGRVFVGNLHRDRGESERAEEQYRAAVELGREQAEASDAPDARMEYGVAQGLLGDALLARGELQEAGEAVRANLAVVRALVEGVGGPTYHGDLVDALDRMVALAERVGGEEGEVLLHEVRGVVAAVGEGVEGIEGVRGRLEGEGD